jgi:serine/threonine protein phosphatase PrpC
MDDIKVTIAARSDIGRVRSKNEDAFTVAELAAGTELATAAEFELPDRGLLLAVSDGMGGHPAGEVASLLVLDSLRQALAADQSGPVQAWLEQAVRRANAAVRSAAGLQNREGMGATLTAVVLIGGEAYIAEVGDSRAYLCRGGRLHQLTRDQSLVQMLVDDGVISHQDAAHSPHRHVIVQAMGHADEVRVAIGRLALRRLDTLLVCSDGVSNACRHDELRRIVSWHPPRKAAARLIDLGNERGGEDNLTVIVAQFDGVGLEQASPAESISDTFEVLQAFTPATPPRA